MRVAQLDELIKSLGLKRDQIHVDGVDVFHPLHEYDFAVEWFSIGIEFGLSMEFRIKTQVFETLHIRFYDDESDEYEYTGQLLEPFKPGMSQAEVRSLFGVPDQSQGPLTLPEPLGNMGGWDVYAMDAEQYPNTIVGFKYLESLTVYALVFKYVQPEA